MIQRFQVYVLFVSLPFTQVQNPVQNLFKADYLFLYQSANNVFYVDPKLANSIRIIYWEIYFTLQNLLLKIQVSEDFA